MREMFGALGLAKTPKELHRQMTKDGTSMSLARPGESAGSYRLMAGLFHPLT